MTLKDTVNEMCSSDYKERFKAEYHQLEIRYNGLQQMLKKWDGGLLDFEPTCPRHIYKKQIVAMESYLTILEERAKMEGVIL